MTVCTLQIQFLRCLAFTDNEEAHEKLHGIFNELLFLLGELNSQEEQLHEGLSNKKLYRTFGFGYSLKVIKCSNL